jgi:hypothetical protein
MAVGFWLYKSRHTLTTLANCARGLPHAAGYQRIGRWHGSALLRHGACGYSWQCWLRRVLGSGDAQMETAARSAWRQVIEVTVVDRVSG